jgi:hypothetical protein
LPGPHETEVARAVGRLLHVSDPERITTWQAWLGGDRPPEVAALGERDRRLLGMLLATLDRSRPASVSASAALSRLWEHPALLEELHDVLARLDAESHDLPEPLRLRTAPIVPIQLHARYTRAEILAAFGHSILTRSLEWREGVRYDQEARTDIFAFTLRKAERDFSPTTMYRDFAISPDLVHWESQITLREEAPTAQRYIHHAQRGTSVLLFARPAKDDRAFTCLGTAAHVEHRNERPIAFVWKLDRAMPEAFFAVARADIA